MGYCDLQDIRQGGRHPLVVETSLSPNRHPMPPYFEQKFTENHLSLGNTTDSFPHLKHAEQTFPLTFTGNMLLLPLQAILSIGLEQCSVLIPSFLVCLEICHSQYHFVGFWCSLHLPMDAHKNPEEWGCLPQRTWLTSCAYRCEENVSSKCSLLLTSYCSANKWCKSH